MDINGLGFYKNFLDLLLEFFPGTLKSFGLKLLVVKEVIWNYDLLNSIDVNLAISNNTFVKNLIFYNQSINVKLSCKSCRVWIVVDKEVF